MATPLVRRFRNHPTSVAGLGSFDGQVDLALDRTLAEDDSGFLTIEVESNQRSRWTPSA